MVRALGVIPAKGSSKRVPKKNLRDLGGKPLIAWTIKAAQAAERLTTFVVSTECQNVAELANKCGAYVVKRPEVLSEDHTSSGRVIKHALEWMGHNDYDIVVCLHPTSPIRDPKHIDLAIDKLSRSSLDTLVSVCQLPRKPHWNVFNCAHYGIQGPTYVANASIYAMKRKWLEMHDDPPLTARMPVLLEMDWRHSVDINEEADFALAEALL